MNLREMGQSILGLIKVAKPAKSVYFTSHIIDCPNSQRVTPMQMFARILRLISLAMLFGGSTATVFAAITLISAAKAQGIPVSEAAAANAPLFIEFSKVALAFAISFVVAEAIEIKGDLKSLEKGTRWRMARYFSSIVCAISTFIFALAIVPQMEDVSVLMKTDESRQATISKVARSIPADIHRHYRLCLGIFGAASNLDQKN
jgi:hypothetical protein